MADPRGILAPFLQPRSAAILVRERAEGAGPILQALTDAGYAGRLTVIGPDDGGPLPFGTKRVELIADLPGAPDLLILDCAPEDRSRLILMAERKGIPAILDLSQAQGDGGRGRRQDTDEEEALGVIAARGQLLLIGPGSAGVADLRLGSPAAFTRDFEVPPGGPVGLVSQSALVTRIVASHGATGLELGCVLDLGNASGPLSLRVPQAVAALARDHGDLEVLALALTDLSAPEVFRDVLRPIAERIPVVAWFPAPPGEAARDAAISAFLEECAVVRVSHPLELVHAARALSRWPAGLEGRVALIGAPSLLPAGRGALAAHGLAQCRAEDAGPTTPRLVLLQPGPHSDAERARDGVPAALTELIAAGAPVVATGIGAGPSQARALKRARDEGALTFDRVADAGEALAALAKRMAVLRSPKPEFDDAPTVI